MQNVGGILLFTNIMSALVLSYHFHQVAAFFIKPSIRISISLACCRGCACNTESSIMAKSIVWNISEWATMPKLHNNQQLRCIKTKANTFQLLWKKHACFLIFPPLEIGWLLFLIFRAESEQAEKVWTWTWSGQSYYILCICGPPTLISNFRGIFRHTGHH